MHDLGNSRSIYKLFLEPLTQDGVSLMATEQTPSSKEGVKFINLFKGSLKLYLLILST